MKTRSLALALVSTFVLASTANATTHNFTVRLEGSQEVPPVVSSGTGLVNVTLDDVTGSVTVSGTYSSLNSAQTAVHIHGPAPAGVNAGVIITLAGTGGTAGTISGGGTLSAGQVTDMLSDLHYINLHTTSSPGGELRGQIRPPAVPASSLGAWMALGLLLAVAGGVLIRFRSVRTA